MSKSSSIILSFTCTGSVRGDCGHLHTTRANAEKCIAKDQRGCAAHGGYSDRTVVVLADIIDRDGDRVQVEVGDWIAHHGVIEDENSVGKVVKIDDDGIEVAWDGEVRTRLYEPRRCIVYRVRPTDEEAFGA